MNSAQNDADRLRSQGLEVETVGDLLTGVSHGNAAPSPNSRRFIPARLEGTPPAPEPGIYFGMSDEEYHAIPALSNSGIKKLAASPMIFWASTPWLSERKRREVAEAKAGGEREHFTMGKAYHCRLMEGASVFALRYAVTLDPADYPDALVSTDQIKAAIARFEQEQPVAPVGNKADLIEQLSRLCAAHDGAEAFSPDAATFADGSKITVDALKERIGQFTELAQVKPVSKVLDPSGPDGQPYWRAAVKSDWIAQLMALNPEAKVFANLEAAHRAKNEGKVFLSFDQNAELETAAAVVENDPELREAFDHGYPEVTLIWHCEATGVPMKARVDYLKVKMMVDLKSVGNQRERSIEQAIRFEIAAYKYNIQPVVYFEAARVVRELVRVKGYGAIWVNGKSARDDDIRQSAEVDFALRWSNHREPDEWLWVFQQKGAAPITRGVWFPRGGTTDLITQEIVRAAKKTFRQYSETFDTAAWLDVRPSYTIADEDIPQSATEI